MLRTDLLTATANAAANSFGVSYGDVVAAIPTPLARKLARRTAGRADLGIIHHGLRMAHNLRPEHDGSPILHAIRLAFVANS